MHTTSPDPTDPPIPKDAAQGRRLLTVAVAGAIPDTCPQGMK